MRLRLLLPSIALIVITTMVPAGLRHFSLHSIVASFDPTDFVNNILLYMPLGIALGGTSLLSATSAGFCLSTLAETLQIGYINRMPSPVDVASNTLGTLLGYLIAKTLRRLGYDPTSIPVPRWLAAVCLLIGVLGAIGLIYRAPVTDFSNWERDGQLAVESSRATVSQLQIYPRNLTNAQVQGLSCRGQEGLPTGGLLPTGDPRSISDGLIRQSRFTLVACLKSSELGPRVLRLVTYGRDHERDFTLAEIDGALLFLVRTPASGPNGWAAAARSGSVLEPNREVLAVAMYDGRFSRLFVDGKLAGQADLGERRPHLPGRVLGWLPQPVPVREIELGAAEAVLAGLLSMGILGLFGVPPHLGRRALKGVAAGVIVGGIVWVFGVSAPRLGLRILLESIVAGLTLSASVTVTNAARRQHGSGMESSSQDTRLTARSPHPASASSHRRQSEVPKRHMRSIVSSLFSLLLSLSAVTALPAQNFTEVKPSPQQVAWQDLEFGVILHFSTNTFLDREWGDGTAAPSVFHPTQFDPDQWMQAIKASGAKYVVLVAKHHDGFCLWPTSQTSYSIQASPWKQGKGDVVGDVARSARKYGLRFGVYLSPWDRHDPRYSDSAAYDKYYLSELEELATRYGDLVEFWLDGAGSEGHVYNFAKIIETLRTYQPNTIVFADTALFEYGDARWVGTESGKVDYENWNVIDRHGYLRWRPVEADTPLRELHWFWHPHDEASLKSVETLTTVYEQTVGRGAQLMLGVAPDDRGLLPESDAARLREFGEAIRRLHAGNLALQHQPATPEISAALDGDLDTFWSAPVGSHNATLEVNLPKPAAINRVTTMEWLNEGQHIEKYAIDVWHEGGWQQVAGGQAIGHEKVDRFPAVTTSRVRLHILSSSQEAHIREFQIYSDPNR